MSVKKNDTLKVDLSKLDDSFLDMTVRDIFALLEKNKPSPKRSYFLELSDFGVNISTGIQATFEKNRRHSNETGNFAFKLLIKTKEEEKAEVQYAELTPLQLERKAKVLGKHKLSEPMLNEIRVNEFENIHEFWISRYGHGRYVSQWNTTEKALGVRGIMFGRSIMEFYKLPNPLPYMTDEGFAIWSDEMANNEYDFDTE